MYHEPKTSRLHGVAFIALVALMALPPALLLELPEALAVEALSSREMLASNSWWPLQLLGQPTDLAPGASWVLAVAGSLGLDQDFGVRFAAFILIVLLAVLNGFAAAGRSRRLAGLVTGAAVLSCLGGIRMTTGTINWILFALLINAAWYVWYEFGRERKSWLFAWCFAYLLVGLALLVIGARALFYFYWPLFFLRRPLRVWRRFGHWDHWVGFLALVGMIALWTLAVPGGGGQLASLLPGLVENSGVQSYLGRLFWIPIVVVIGFFPWCGLVWPGFCAAFRPLESQPVYCSYLRTICISMFLFVWLVPVDDGAHALLPLIGPAAILLSRNYTLLVRRHGAVLQRMCRLMAVSALGGGVATLVLAALFSSGLGEALMGRGLQGTAIVWMISIAAIGSLLAASLIWRSAQRPVWFAVALSMGALHLTLFAAVGIPVESYFTAGQYRAAGKRVASGLPEDVRLYWYGAGPRSAAAAWYLDREVIAVADDELPHQESVIYVMTPGRKPSDGHWHWLPVSESLALGESRVRIWVGRNHPSEP